MSEFLMMPLSATMNIVAELCKVNDCVYFHAEYDDGEKASRGYSSDLLDMAYSYADFDNELEAIPVVAEMWAKVNKWVKEELS